LIKPYAVRKIQGLIRTRIALKRAKFFRFIKSLRFKQQVFKYFKFRTILSRVNREKETYLLQRYALAKVEVDQIMKYVQMAENKFEINWSQYEQSLEKYLLSTQKQYKDWVQRRDETTGNTVWINIKTLKEQFDHPGKAIFQQNKRALKLKAEEELRENFKPIYERRLLILETIFDVKMKIAADFRKTRSRLFFNKENEDTVN
jgi:hypothetical protein